MTKATTIFAIVVMLICSSAGATDIYSLIKDGKLSEAAALLSSASTASNRDGNSLFYLALLERKADQSAQLLEAALNASVSPKHTEEVYYRLAQYHLMKGNYSQLGNIIKEYRTNWENGKYLSQIMRYALIVEEKAGSWEKAVRGADRYLEYYPRGDESQYGLIDKARIMQSYKKYVAARELLRKISRSKSGPGIPQAMYLLGRDAARRNRLEDAVFFHSMLRERYPAAVGLDGLLDLMSKVSDADATDDVAEKRTGTYYSIQVGVFSVVANARRQKKIFEDYGHKVEIKRKKISDRTYQVVYVGRFTSFSRATEFKKKLEAAHGQVFQVIAR